MKNKPKYNELCIKCKKTCKQLNFLRIVRCSYEYNPKYVENVAESPLLEKDEKIVSNTNQTTLI